MTAAFSVCVSESATGSAGVSPSFQLSMVTEPSPTMSTVTVRLSGLKQ